MCIRDRSAVSKVQQLTHTKINNIDLVEIILSGNKHYLLAFNAADKIKNNQLNTFSFNGSKYQFDGRFKLFNIKE